MTTLLPEFSIDGVPSSPAGPPDPEFDWLVAPLLQALGPQADTPAVRAAVLASEERFRQMAGRMDLGTHTRAGQAARRSVEDLGRIARLQQEMASLQLDLPTLVTLVVQRTQELAGADGCSLELLEDDDQLVVRAGSGRMAGFIGRQVDRHHSLSSKALAQRQMMICDDTEQDDRVDRKIAREVGVRSLIAAPLRSGDKMLGVLVASYVQPHA